MLWLALFAPCPSLVLAQDRLVETRRMVPALGPYAYDAEAGDLNADGELDVIMLTKGPTQPILLHGTGGGRFVDASAAADLVAGTSLGLGDIDGDGDTDVFASQQLLTQQSGQLVIQQVFPVIDSPVDVALGDVDADGDLDALLGGNPGSPNLYRNDGTGFYAEAIGAVPAGGGPTVPGGLALADFDGDSDLDAFVGGAPDRFLINVGGTFVAGTPFPTSSTWDVETADVDGDGDVDAFSQANSIFGPSGALLMNGGAAGFSATTLITGVTPKSPRLRDWNGDGATDLVAFTTGGAVAWTSSGGALAPGGLAFPSYVNAEAAAAGDFDQDGDQDLMPIPVGLPIPDGVSYGGMETARLWLNSGVGSFGELQERVTRPGFGLAGTDLATGDVNGDGYLDVYVCNHAAERDALYLGDGAASLTDASGKLPDEKEATVAAALHDLDGDGDLDAALGGLGLGRVLRNDGSGTFAPLPGALASADHAYSFAPADVDGDGDDDLFTTHPPLAPADVSLWLNDGSAAFAPSGFAGVVNDPMTPRAADLDLDGDVDLLVAGDELHAYANDGAGTFSKLGAPMIPLLSGVFAIDVGDCDHDGDADVLACASTPGGSGILKNDGSGNLGQPTSLGVHGAGRFADVDGDGRLDVHIFAYVIGKPLLRLFFGDGSGTYGAPEELHGVAAGRFVDLDLDGDLEGLGTANGVRVWLNVAGGAIARETPPSIGKKFAMSVYGQPLTPWALAASPFPASIPLPPYGTLQLNPAKLVIVASGIVPPTGRAELAIPVGPVPSLLGVTVHWQGMVGWPLHLTPREPSVVTGF